MAQHAPQTNSKQHHMPAHTNRKQHGVADKIAHNSKVEEHGTVKTKNGIRRLWHSGGEQVREQRTSREENFMNNNSKPVLSKLRSNRSSQAWRCQVPP